MRHLFLEALPQEGVTRVVFVLPDDLAQARLLVDQAVHLYNEERPHLALNYLTPNQVHQQGKSPAGKSERGPCLIPVNI